MSAVEGVIIIVFFVILYFNNLKRLNINILSYRDKKVIGFAFRKARNSVLCEKQFQGEGYFT